MSADPINEMLLDQLGVMAKMLSRMGIPRERILERVRTYLDGGTAPKIEIKMEP